MSISGIGTNSYSMGQMSSIGSRPSPSEMFSNDDEDGSGGLDKTEFSTLAQQISQATGEDIDVDELYATYDVDGDGELSEEETQAVMEDYRPEPPPEGEAMGGMPGGGGTDLSEIFSDTDEDEDGSIDETEAETLAEMISEATGEEISVEDLIAAYDEDGDGVLSEEETAEALEANRPEGPPPPPPEEAQAESEETSVSSAATAAIETYLKMAALGTGEDPSSDAAALFGNGGSTSVAASLYSLNTVA
ncbi:EF-hand domain-containing protein [Desulfosarcina ovata]|uniref:EF-hand domain-containing protein n=1 Tax=Desulfosarcina ovata subsp. ovata TaxID=2752305 RepID=A0A5K8AGT7_9BACT|nr:EF-hand domain-containing protein [Desulfosarcina ovata]BBO91778.1 hypothetical protein DSCOOX_49580 [Desulfosarcina ovata subsp. ovata]